MISTIIDLLKQDKFYNVSNEVDIAKGKYEIPRSWKGVKNMFKRM
jgi:hypothetical protein|tara:strand:+ start:816 stop:950 length:135 start_codon:yes stop_codon:yes gene_type:complete